MPVTSCLYGLYRILYSDWLAHFCLMKKSVKVLHYFGLDCGLLEELGGLYGFLYEAVQNFEVFSNIQD